MSRHRFPIDEAMLREMVAKGMTDRQIAAELGTTDMTVCRRRKIHGIPPRKPKGPQIDEAVLRELVCQGLSDTQVAVQLGCTSHTVWRYRQHLDIANAFSACGSHNAKRPPLTEVDIQDAMVVLDARITRLMAGRRFRDCIRPSTGPLPRPWPKPENIGSGVGCAALMCAA